MMVRVWYVVKGDHPSLLLEACVIIYLVCFANGCKTFEMLSLTLKVATNVNINLTVCFRDLKELFPIDFCFCLLASHFFP